MEGDDDFSTSFLSLFPVVVVVVSSKTASFVPRRRLRATT